MDTGKQATALGVDLGGGYSKALIIYNDGSLEKVTDSRGAELFRTAVYHGTDGQYLFAEDAIDQGFVDPDNLATDFKRNFGSPEKLYFKGTASAEDVAVELIKFIKGRAETQTGQTIKHVVFTFPANYPDIAKNSLIGAYRRAGLTYIPEGPDGVGMLFEPTAAARAYGSEHGLKDQDVKVGVIDFGTTTLDVSISWYHNDQAETLATEGVLQLGGSNLLRALMALALGKAAKAGLPNAASSMDAVQKHDFEQACERAKIALSTQPKVLISIQAGSKRKTIEVSQTEYHDEIAPLMKQMCDCVDKALATANLAAKDLNYVVQVGGPSRSSFVQKTLETHLGVKPKTDIDPSLAIVTGAAKHGYWLLERRRSGSQAIGIRLRECVPHNIGMIIIKHNAGKPERLATVLIDKGLPVPATITRSFYLLHIHQTECHCQFVQCDREDAPPEECYTLGEALLTEIPPEDIKSDRIEVTATFSAAGIVTVSIRDKVSGRVTPLVLDKNAGLRPAAA